MFLLYALIPSKNYYWDGISFAQTIEDARSWPTLFHPNHLLYNLIGFGAYHALGTAFRALYVLQALNAVFAACTVYCLFGILTRIVRSVSVAAALTSLFAFSGTWWRFATDANAYVLAVLLLVLCFSGLLPSERPNAIRTGVLHALAMLIHQLSVFFFPVALLGLWYQSERAPFRRRLWTLASYSATAGVCTIVAYALAYRMVSGELHPAGLIGWVASHSEDSAFSFDILKSFAVSLRSWLQLLFSGRPSLLNYGNASTIALLALALWTFFMLLVAIWKRLRTGNYSWTMYQPRIFRLTVLWVGTFAAFLLFWLPHNTFYKLLPLPGLILLIGSYCRPGCRLTFRSPGVLFIILLAVANFTFAIVPYSKVSANAAVGFALDLQRSLDRGAIVYFSNFNTDDWFARYFNPQSQWKHADSTVAVDSDLDAGKTVWLDTTALDRLFTTAPNWLRSRIQGTESRALVDSKHRIIFTRLAPGHRKHL